MEIIRQVEIYKCPVKLKEPFIISLGKLEYADNLIVVIHTSGGITGFGECSPFLTIHGENSETGVVIGKLIAHSLIGKDPIAIEECHRLMDVVVYGNTSIKSAFDIALYDIASQRAGQPLYKFLGGSNKKLFTDYTVSFNNPEKMADDAGKIVAAGFPFIKVKLGGKEDEDFLRMKMIRQKTGNEIPIRIDANQGWNVETAKRLLVRLNEFNIQHCEEPVNRNQFMYLPEIRKSSPVKIMSDESCFDHHDAERLVKLNACELINVKLGKSSGIFKAMKITAIAERENMLLQAGGFLESRLGFTAAAHLALSSEKYAFIDFDTPLMFCEDPVEGGMNYAPGGEINVPDSIGLGARITENILKKLSSVIIN